MQLGNSGDEVVLVHDGVEIDEVAYDSGVTWPDPTGHSFGLDPSALNHSDNDDPANWCVSTTTYGDGDEGTPGDENDLCS
jgi:hypothetical protein